MADSDNESFEMDETFGMRFLDVKGHPPFAKQVRMMALQSGLLVDAVRDDFNCEWKGKGKQQYEQGYATDPATGKHFAIYVFDGHEYEDSEDWTYDVKELSDEEWAAKVAKLKAELEEKRKQKAAQNAAKKAAKSSAGDSSSGGSSAGGSSSAKPAAAKASAKPAAKTATSSSSSSSAGSSKAGQKRSAAAVITESSGADTGSVSGAKRRKLSSSGAAFSSAADEDEDEAKPSRGRASARPASPAGKKTTR
jgi:ribosomal protein L29